MRFLNFITHTKGRSRNNCPPKKKTLEINQSDKNIKFALLKWAAFSLNREISWLNTTTKKNHQTEAYHLHNVSFLWFITHFNFTYFYFFFYFLLLLRYICIYYLFFLSAQNNFSHPLEIHIFYGNYSPDYCLFIYFVQFSFYF